MIRFGAPVFMKKQEKAAGPGESHGSAANDPVALARAVKAKGYRAAYAPKVDLNDTARIKAVRDAFAAEDIMIAEVGYWQNLMDTDEATRKEHREEMVKALALADELGARCAVDIVGYEIFPFDVIDGPEAIETLLKAVDRKQFAVHLDLVNLINGPRAYFRSGDIMRECVKRFGGRIVSAHAKDIKMKEPSISVILEEVVAGTGNLDIATYVRELHKLPQEIPLMLEHLKSEAEYETAVAHYRAVAAKEGIVI